MEIETKYILAGIVVILWFVVRVYMMRRRSARIQRLRDEAAGQPEEQNDGTPK